MAEPLQVSQDTPQSRLEGFMAQATANYAVKDYRAAAELYSRGTELQSEINGEMSTQNADLLYLYGRCLYHVAVMKSDVLGTKVASETPEQSSKEPKSKGTKGEQTTPAVKIAPIEEDAVATVASKGDPTNSNEAGGKPFFQFTGDENFVESDDDGVADEEDGEAAEEEDDFSNAFEVLDLARVLLERRLEEVEESDGKGKGKGKGVSEPVKQLKERLADTYDLQAEISLENEQFPNAATDLKAALKLKQEVFPQDSSVIAEAHYKLSLALEFSSVTQQKNADGEAMEGQTAQVDKAMREDAAKEMESAISSCRMRIEREEAALASGEASANGDNRKPKVTRESIDDVKEMVQDMEQRVTELRQPPVSVNESTGAGAINGILGSLLGEAPEMQKAHLEEASKGANDLTNLVKRKKPMSPLAAETSATLKRRVEASEGDGTGKKARLEDGED